MTKTPNVDEKNKTEKTYIPLKSSTSKYDEARAPHLAQRKVGLAKIAFARPLAGFSSIPHSCYIIINVDSDSDSGDSDSRDIKS